MGLDMYLDKRSYVKNWGHTDKNDQHEVTVKRGGILREDIKPDRVKAVVEEVCYWRKANAIHGWFVNNVQDGQDDCREYGVSAEQLSELLAKVNVAIAAFDAGEKEKLDEVLPPMKGFFFGTYEYDEWYKKDLEHTKQSIEEVLAEIPEGNSLHIDFIYQASW